MVEFLLFARNSATGTVKAVFLQLFYFAAFYLHLCGPVSAYKPTRLNQATHIARSLVAVTSIFPRLAV